MRVPGTELSSPGLEAGDLTYWAIAWPYIDIFLIRIVIYINVLT